MDPSSGKRTGDNEGSTAETKPTDLRLGQHKSGGGRSGSDHSRHGRVECVLAGAGVKDIEHRFDCCGASGVRGRSGNDRTQALIVDRQKIQRV
jgi:hypothetical protein